MRAARTSGHRVIVVAATLAVGVITPIVAFAAGPKVDLASSPARWFGAGGANALGQVVAGGDVNGDARPDVIMYAPGSTPGSVNIAVGGLPGAPVDLAGATPGLWRIVGSSAASNIGGSGPVAAVDAAGDVDGDGFGDVIVGAPFANDGARDGAAYLVYGSTTPANVDLAAPGVAATRLTGSDPVGGPPGRAGDSVSGVGDVNGDGRADVAVTERVGVADKINVRVVFGATSRADLDLGALAARGFTITGVPDDLGTASVSAVGDLNGDGLADVAIGAPGADDGLSVNVGRVLVIAGRASSGAVDATDPGSVLMSLNGGIVGDRVGTEVARLGDVNGDGRSDLLVGADGAGPSGIAYVVFGTETPTSRLLSPTVATPIGYVRIRDALFSGDSTNTGLFGTVAGAGDFDDDGLADILVGEQGAGYGARTESGSVHVVLGRTTWPSDIPLDEVDSAPPDQTIRVDGAPQENLGQAGLAGVGDVDGDGADDLALAADRLESNGTDVGKGTVVLVRGVPKSGTPGVTTDTVTTGPPPPPPPPAATDLPPPPPPISPFGEQPTAAAVLLGCLGARIAVLDVVARGGSVQVRGQTRAADAGRRAKILIRARRGAPLKVVGEATVTATGAFAAAVALPSRAVRSSAAYAARLESVTSRAVELQRRMLVTSVQTVGAKVTLAGKVVGVRAGRPVVITVQAACAKRVKVASVKPRLDGSFRVTVSAAPGVRTAIYRAQTVVPFRRGRAVEHATFTLPVAVDLAPPGA